MKHGVYRQYIIEMFQVTKLRLTRRVRASDDVTFKSLRANGRHCKSVI